MGEQTAGRLRDFACNFCNICYSGAASGGIRVGNSVCCFILFMFYLLVYTKLCPRRIRSTNSQQKNKLQKFAFA